MDLEKNRSCSDHIYALYTIINNRKLSRQSTFVSFVDFHKAFDKVDRDLLCRQVTIFQESARNHFWEAGIVMQSYMVETVHQPFRNNSFLACTPGNDFYVNSRGQRSSSAFFNF